MPSPFHSVAKFDTKNSVQVGTPSENSQLAEPQEVVIRD